MADRYERDYGNRKTGRGENLGGRRPSAQDYEEFDEGLDWDVRRSRTYDPYWQHRRRSSAYENYSRPFGQTDFDDKDPERDYYDRGGFNDWEYERRQYTRNFGLDRNQMMNKDRDRTRGKQSQQETQPDWRYDPEEEENREYGYDRSYSRGFYGFNRNDYPLGPRYGDRWWDEAETRDQYTLDNDYTETDYDYEEWWVVPGPYEGIGPRGYQRSDDRIFEDVCERISLHGQIDAKDVDVQVENGEVILTGTVNDRRTKRLIEDTVDAIPGLTDIRNELRVQKRDMGSK